MKGDSPKNSMDSRQVQALLRSPEARALLKLLEEGGSMEAAAEALRRGEPEKARALLRPVTEQPEAAALLTKLKGK